MTLFNSRNSSRSRSRRQGERGGGGGGIKAEPHCGWVLAEARVSQQGL